MATRVNALADVSKVLVRDDVSRPLVQLLNLADDLLHLVSPVLEVGVVDLEADQLFEHLENRVGTLRIDEVAAGLAHQTRSRQVTAGAETEQETADADDAARRFVVPELDASLL